jgi:hypothetical protein
MSNTKQVLSIVHKEGTDEFELIYEEHVESLDALQAFKLTLMAIEELEDWQNEAKKNIRAGLGIND